jgi:hypothetical protein
LELWKGSSRKGAVEVLEFGFDDLRDWRDIKVIVEGIFGDIPMGIEDSAEDFRLETLDPLDVGRLGWTPQLNAISPRRFEDGFVYYKFVMYEDELFKRRRRPNFLLSFCGGCGDSRLGAYLGIDPDNGYVQEKE